MLEKSRSWNYKIWYIVREDFQAAIFTKTTYEQVQATASRRDIHEPQIEGCNEKKIPFLNT